MDAAAGRLEAVQLARAAGGGPRVSAARGQVGAGRGAGLQRRGHDRLGVPRGLWGYGDPADLQLLSDSRPNSGTHGKFVFIVFVLTDNCVLMIFTSRSIWLRK